MSEWQQIETAPKDGTWILAFGQGVKGMPVMAWDTDEPRVPMCVVISWNELWYDDFVEVSPGVFRKERKLSHSYWRPEPQQFAPTHWMPLPDLPQFHQPAPPGR